MKVLNVIGSFDEVVLWGHDSAPPEDDAFVKGVGKWIHFAEAVRLPIAILDPSLITEVQMHKPG